MTSNRFGRPPIEEQDRLKGRNVRLKRAQWDFLDAVAEQEATFTSELIREALAARYRGRWPG